MAISKKQKVITRKEAYLKACHFCAYQERLQQEVRQKLEGMMLSSDDIEDILSDLIQNNFINEERYAKAYAGGKFRIKKWGRLKIRNSLEGKKVSDYCINKGLLEIEEEDYRKVLSELLQIKKTQSDEKNTFVLKNKLSDYAIGKGYEPDLVWKMIQSMAF